MDSRNKKKIFGNANKKKIFGIANKKMKGRKNKRSASSTSSKRRRRRSQDVKILFNHELKDMKTLRSNDDAFHLSLKKIKKIIDIIRSWKTPTRETYMQWDEYAISFYLKMCTCFGVDYQHLEATSDDDDENGKKPLKQQEEHMESSGVKLLRLTMPKPRPREEVLKDLASVDIIYCRRSIWGPFEFGYYSSGTTPDRIPYHLYLLAKEAVDIMNNTNDLPDLTIVEKKIRFFCNYFYSHLPAGWNYDRNKASSLIADYDTTIKPRYLVAGYTPTRVFNEHNSDANSRISKFDMADVMNIIHSRKMPSFWEMSSEEISFYCKLCSCFGIDYHRLEAASVDVVCLMNTGGKPMCGDHGISK